MQTTNHDMVDGRAGRIGEGLSPRIVGIITYFAPVNCAEDKRQSGRLQNETVRVKRVQNLLALCGEHTHASMVQGDGDIDGER